MADNLQPQTDIAVVGAGIIGVACALQLARQGRRVVVIDQQEPGMGASFGNAGHLATEQVFPIADLSILMRLPAMLPAPRPALVCSPAAEPATGGLPAHRRGPPCAE